MEVWKDIEGFEGLYQISNEGNGKSLERYIESDKKTRLLKERQLVPKEINSKDYLCFHLFKNGKDYFPTIHQLVAQAFIPNPNNYDVVHHIDEDPTNNKVENLMWMDRSEHQSMHMKERHSHNVGLKQVCQYTLDGKLVNIWKSAYEAAETLGYTRGNICDCCREKRKQAYGFIWSYNFKF